MTPENKDVAGLLPSSEGAAIDATLHEVYVGQGPRGLMTLCRKLLTERAIAAPGAATAAREQPTDAQIMALWRELTIPSDEGGHTTGLLPFARALLKAAERVQADTMEAAFYQEVGGSPMSDDLMAERRAWFNLGWNAKQGGTK